MRSVLQDYLDSVLETLSGVDSGEVADYIPELATVNPDGFGIAIVTTDGHVYHSGDTDTLFTIQSMSKPFTYGMALAEHGLLRVSSKIDVEPSGDAFNEISLDPISHRPRNPMINAGAITAASLSGPGTADERFARIQRTYSAFAGRELTLDQEVYASEHRTGDRNRAIGYMLKGGGILEEDPEEALSVYFRQCSLSVTAIDMAYMAATLAASGVNPKTGERVLEPQLVERVLSVMTTCGMYDGAGDWVTEVGLPAKSGVGGGIIAVLPGQFGIAVYSPRLDQHGNSVRGVQVCRKISRELGLHFMHVPRSGKSAVHGSFTVDESPSRRARTLDQQDVLDREGSRALVLQAQGDLFFAGAEAVSRAAAEASADVDLLVLDLTAVEDINSVAAGMLLAQRRILALQDCRFLVVDPEGQLAEAVGGAESPWGDAIDPPLVFGAVEEAVRWSEDWLLDRYGEGAAVATELTLAEHPLFRQLSPAAQAALTPLIEIVDVEDGTTVVRRGEPAKGVFLILAGTAYTGAGRLDGASDLLPGASFGEMVTVAGRPHLADVSARGPLRVAVLRTEAYRAAERQEPSALLELLSVLVRSATQTVERVVRGQEAARR